MKARLIQLLSRYLAAGFTALAGVLGVRAEQGDTDSLAVAVVSAVLAVVLYFADLLIHRAETGGISKPAGTVKRSLRVLAPVALVFAMSGCATPSQQWAVQRESVSATQDVIVDLHSAEMISDQDVLDVAPWVQAARTEVNLAYLQLPDGGPTFDSQLNRAADFVALIRQTLYGATYAGNQSTDER